jgi:thymidylate synthase (FAD)
MEYHKILKEPSVELVDLTGEIGIVNSARVSYNQHKKILDQKDYKLITYLKEHNHKSPFMHPQKVFKIKDGVLVDEILLWKSNLSQYDIQGIEFNENLEYMRASLLFFNKHSEDILHFFQEIQYSEIPETIENKRILYLSFRVEAPVFVARQLVKHRVGLAWNEMSLRYVDLTENLQFWIPQELRLQDNKNKQSSSGVHPNSNIFLKKILSFYGNAEELYEYLVCEGVSREQARTILPLSIITKWVWTASLDDFARVCNLRLHENAQKETQEVASKVATLCHKKYKFFNQLIKNYEK